MLNNNISEVTIEELHNHCITNKMWCEFHKGRVAKWVKGEWI